MTRFFEYQTGRFINLADVRRINIPGQPASSDTKMVEASVIYSNGDTDRIEMSRFSISTLVRALGDESIVAAAPGYQLAIYSREERQLMFKSPVVAFRFDGSRGYTMVEAICADGSSSCDDRETYVIIKPDGQCREINDVCSFGWFDDDADFIKWKTAPHDGESGDSKAETAA